MKHTHFAAAIIAALLAATSFPADEPRIFDLDGREVIVRVYSDNNFRGTYKQITATAKDRTIKLDLADPNESTSFKIIPQDQLDPVVKEFLAKDSRGWAYSRLGLEYFLYYSADEFEGRTLAVRIYRDGDDISEYKPAILKLPGRRVKCDFGELDYAAFVVIFGQDQTDPLIKHILGNSIHGQAYKSGMEIRPPPRPVDTQSEYLWEFYDATGNALSGGQVQLRFQSRYREFKLGTIDLDLSGRVVLPFCVAGHNCKILTSFYPSTYCKLHFTISADEHNTCIIEPGGCVKSGPVYSPSVPPGSEADSRSIWGSVMDPNGRPVAGAIVKGLGLIPPGAKWVSDVEHQRHSVVTNKQGKFRMYLPISEEAYQVGALIPHNTEYAVEINPPEGANLAPFKGRILNGRHSKITLDYAGHLHTFVFEDQEGPINDPKLLKDVEMVIERPGQRNLWFRYKQLKDGATMPLGTYKAKVYGPRVRIEFQPLTVTADSPEQLVFKVPTAKTYYGRVVNGITAEPMAGAFVIASGRYSERKNLSYLTAEHWDALHALDATNSASDPNFKEALQPVTDCYSVTKMERTDRDGRFRLAEPPKKTVRDLVVFEQSYLTIHVPKRWAKTDEGGNHKFGNIRLFPAATLKVHPIVNVKTRHDSLEFRPQWSLTSKDNPAWEQDLLAACEKHPENGIRREFWLEAGQQHYFQVPANLSLRVHLRVLHGIEWVPLTIADGIRLQPAEVRDLGRVEITKPFNISVEVTNSTGSGVEGVPVTACGNWDPAISSTDEHGFAFFDFVGYSKGEFIVESHPEDNAGAPPLRQTIPYEVNGPEDANTVYTIQLSDKMLQSLFNQ